MISVTIASEDELSEAVVERLLSETARFRIAGRLRRGGNGYLKRIAGGLNLSAPGHPYVLLTDLDYWPCPSKLRDAYVPAPLHSNFCFRIAVRTIESWLLADVHFTTKILGVSEALAPSHPDSLPKPKLELVNLARRSRRQIRKDLVPQDGSTAVQGRNYNAPLVAFVRESWRPAVAAERSPSLARCIDRLDAWHPTP
jgi:hypothetical protein